MNQIFLSPDGRQSTQAAEGLPRWRWTVAEIERVAAAGLFTEYDRFELIGGEIVPMSPKGLRHERLRNMLVYRWTKLVPENVMIASESQFNLASDTYLNPDILVHPMAIHTDKLRGPEALLVVEVSETSLSYDLNAKLGVYASHGVPEYWVINAVTLRTTMHRQPLEQTYAIAEEFSADATLVPSLIPELAIALKTLRLD
ncbi:MAG TPA: Uma2 family endonuclease [Xanthobacteraceae bacterium]|jgi:Uma2 family endonuclease|nr:Uma2 family endonuclease [Xanthobacteraceae bacterium]